MPNHSTQEAHDRDGLLSSGVYSVETVTGLQERGVAPGVILDLIRKNPTSKPEEIVAMAEKLAEQVEQNEADAKAAAKDAPVQSMAVHIVDAPKPPAEPEPVKATRKRVTPANVKDNPHGDDGAKHK